MFVAVVVLFLFCCFSVCFVVVLHCRQNRLKKQLLSQSQPLMGDHRNTGCFLVRLVVWSHSPPTTHHPYPLPLFLQQAGKSRSLCRANLSSRRNQASSNRSPFSVPANISPSATSLALPTYTYLLLFLLLGVRRAEHSDSS